jgi:cytochrome c-type biogenesis protein CcmH
MNRSLQTLFVFALFSWGVLAADTPVTFESPADRERYDTLLEELRCLVCQNQSLSDSHAELAQDLRDQVYAMIMDGKDNAAIADFMVARYGDFVLYKPPVKSSTWLLWFGPLLMLVLALAVVAIFARGRIQDPQPLSDEERRRVQSLIKSDLGQRK